MARTAKKTNSNPIKRGSKTRRVSASPDVELVSVANRHALIVINRQVIKSLPGVNIIPFSGNRAFLTLDIDRGISDLELAVNDSLRDDGQSRRERQALTELQSRLRAWRRDALLQFHTRAIIVAERLIRPRHDRRD